MENRCPKCNINLNRKEGNLNSYLLNLKGIEEGQILKNDVKKLGKCNLCGSTLEDIKFYKMFEKQNKGLHKNTRIRHSFL